MKKQLGASIRSEWLNDTSPSLGWAINADIRKRLKKYFDESDIVKKLSEKYPSIQLSYFSNGSIDSVTSKRLITIQLLPFIANELNLSLSWILTGHDIGEVGCLRVPTEEGREFHRRLLLTPIRDRKIIRDVSAFYRPMIQPAAKPMEYRVCDISENWMSVIEDIDTWYNLPKTISPEVTDYYGLPSDETCLSVKESTTDTPYYAAVRTYYRRIQYSCRSNGAADIGGLICLMDAAGLPINLCFQWGEVCLYSADANADWLTDNFLSASSEGKETMWALLERKVKHAEN